MSPLLADLTRALTSADLSIEVALIARCVPRLSKWKLLSSQTLRRLESAPGEGKEQHLSLRDPQPWKTGRTRIAMTGAVLTVSSAAKVRATIRIATGGAGGDYREGLASRRQTLLGPKLDASNLGLGIVPAWPLARSLLVLHSSPPEPTRASYTLRDSGNRAAPSFAQQLD